MKKSLLYFGFALFFACVGCEDVIDVDVPSEEPRLVVEALIRVDINEEFIPVEVKVSTTSGFFEGIPVTTLERIDIIYEEHEDDAIISTGSSNLIEKEPGTGIYYPNPNFTTEQRIRTNILDRNWTFSLIIQHAGRKYIAQTKYVPAVPIDDLVHGDDTLFGGDETEIIISFTDNQDRDDFYLFDFNFGEYLVTEDEFYKGQQFQFSYFYNQTFQSGAEIEVSILGVDEGFYNYMDMLIEQSGETQGPFQTPVATVRGNVFDITDLNNRDQFDNAEQPNVFPLGYFAIVQEFKHTLTIE